MDLFTLGRFGSIKTNFGAIAMLEWFIWISLNAAIQNMVLHGSSGVAQCSLVHVLDPPSPCSRSVCSVK